MNLPERNATWVTGVIGVFLCLLSLRWLFIVEDVSQFILFFVSGTIYLGLAHILEKQDFLIKKIVNHDYKFDSMEYPNEKGI